MLNDLKVLVKQSLPYCPPEQLVAAFMAYEAGFGLISDGGSLGRWSYLGIHPDKQAYLGFDDAREAKDFLRGFIDMVHIDYDETLPPFSGGTLGLASFEFGSRLENLERRAFHFTGRAPWPDLSLMRFACVLAFDHHHETLTAIGRGADVAQAKVRLRLLVQAFEQAKGTACVKASDIALAEQMISDTSDAGFEAKISRLIRKIEAGELFQANLARHFYGRLLEKITPADVMTGLLRGGLVPYAGFWRSGGRVVVSHSPERFIGLSHNGRLETRPIKGTRPRGQTFKDDVAEAETLMNSAKDKAENLMIVDLMRHDLGKLSKTGSVKVEALQALETYPNVHHLVSTISGQIKDGLSAIDVLLATLPAGSISGAPKVAAIKVIHEMERARGPYCGSLFYIDAAGGMDSNVLIRTLAFEALEDGHWHYKVCGGAGITADSDPASERRECDTKLSLIRKVLLGDYHDTL
jgi:para-aminobenzoate synthetase component I